MQRSLPILVCLAYLLAPLPSQALTVDGSYYALAGEFEYLTDPGGQLTLEDILARPSRHPFTSSRNSKPEEGFDPVWLKLELDFTEAAQARRYFLYGRMENIYDLRIYRPDGQGGYSEWVTGNNYPASSRELDTLRYGFTIQPGAKPTTLFLRIVGGPGNHNLPWDLVEEQSYLENSHLYYSLDVAAFSGIGALLFFNLVIALSLRRADYFYYSAYVFSVTMALLTLEGIGFYYLWPDMPALNGRALHGFNLLSASLRLLAILSFLDIARLAPGWYSAAKGILALLALTLVAVVVIGVPNLPPYTATIAWAIGILYGFAVCGYAISAKINLAWPLFITLLIPGVSAALQALLTVNGFEVGILGLQIAKIGFAVHVMMFSLCLAAHIKLESDSHRVALHDNLTGLPGMKLLEERFEWAAIMSRRQDWKMGVFFIDLDGFKGVNDSLGHAAGDRLLIEVGARMQGVLRRTDFVARMGGDEFVGLMIDLKEDDSVVPVANKLLTALAAPYDLDGREVQISASIGIALFPNEGEDLPGLLKAADRAMYRAKDQGKNTFTVANSGLTPQLAC